MICGVVAMLFLSVGAMFVTADRWVILRSLTVIDAHAGQEVAIIYDREFKRDFIGAWNVFVWQIQRGEWSAFCEAHGQWPYATARPAKSRTLSWLTNQDPRCSELPPGEYAIDVHVTANPASILARTARIRSNVFTVTN